MMKCLILFSGLLKEMDVVFLEDIFLENFLEFKMK